MRGGRGGATLVLTIAAASAACAGPVDRAAFTQRNIDAGDAEALADRYPAEGDAAAWGARLNRYGRVVPRFDKAGAVIVVTDPQGDTYREAPDGRPTASPFAFVDRRTPRDALLLLVRAIEANAGELAGEALGRSENVLGTGHALAPVLTAALPRLAAAARDGGCIVHDDGGALCGAPGEKPVRLARDASGGYIVVDID